MLFWKRYAEAQAKLENELRHQILAKDERIRELSDENAVLKAKIERMELALMPLTSRAGSVYVQSLTPPKSAPPAKPADEPRGWLTYLNNYMQQTEESEKQAKEKANGIHSA